MRYLIHFGATIEAGQRIEASGGPGPLFNYLVERCKAEAIYVTPTRREGWCVANIDDPAVLLEVALVASNKGGVEPTFTPIYTVQEFGPMAAKAIEGANKVK